MSKIAKAIDAKLLRKDAYELPFEPLKYVDLKYDAAEFISPVHGSGTELRLEAVIGYSIVFPKGDDSMEGVRGLKRAIIEEIFGEFRAPLYDIWVAVRAGRRDDALRMINEMQDSMFNDGL